MATPEALVQGKYGDRVVQSMKRIWNSEALPQANRGLKEYYLSRAEEAPQAKGCEDHKHKDATDDHMLEMLYKMVLYSPEEWYKVACGEQPPADLKNDFSGIGVAFDASSRLRRAGIEYYHDRLSLSEDGISGVFYVKRNLQGGDPELQALPTHQLPVRDSRAIRVVCVSDTHLLHKEIEIPAGDLLLHAGDLSYEESRSQDAARFEDEMEQSRKTGADIVGWLYRQRFGLNDALQWLGTVGNFKERVLVGGNHDYILEQLGPDKARKLCGMYNVKYLCEEEVVKKLDFSEGRTLAIWGSPVSLGAGVHATRAVKSGNASFQVDSDETSFQAKAQRIKNVDILVTHTPPVGMLLGKAGKTLDAINAEIMRMKPGLYVCGHAHNGNDLTQGRVAAIGGGVGVNAACASTWNHRHGKAVVYDLIPEWPTKDIDGIQADFSRMGIMQMEVNKLIDVLTKCAPTMRPEEIQEVVKLFAAGKSHVIVDEFLKWLAQ